MIRSFKRLLRNCVMVGIGMMLMAITASGLFGYAMYTAKIKSPYGLAMAANDEGQAEPDAIVSLNDAYGGGR